MQRTGSILVVDSEPTIVALLVELLTDAGYGVLTALDYASALHTIITAAPALLLLDIRLPDVQSSELIPLLRGGAAATMPIVLMTTDPHAVELLLVPGALMCIAKPFDIDELLDCVARYVQPIDTGSTVHPHRAYAADSDDGKRSGSPAGRLRVKGSYDSA